MASSEHVFDPAALAEDPAGHAPERELESSLRPRSMREFVGQARAVGAERVQLGVQRLLAAVGFVPPLDRGRKRIECER